MPGRPLKPCTTPGCPHTHTGNGRCPVCRGRQRRTTNQRRPGWAEMYGPEWPHIRFDYLARNPVCKLCGRLASVADHHPRGIVLLRRHNVANPHDDKYLRPLCKPCHDKSTGRREPGGWNRDRR